MKTKYFINVKTVDYFLTIICPKDETGWLTDEFKVIEVDVVAYYLYSWFRIRPSWIIE